MQTKTQIDQCVARRNVSGPYDQHDRIAGCKKGSVCDWLKSAVIPLQANIAPKSRSPCAKICNNIRPTPTQQPRPFTHSHKTAPRSSVSTLYAPYNYSHACHVSQLCGKIRRPASMENKNPVSHTPQETEDRFLLLLSTSSCYKSGSRLLMSARSGKSAAAPMTFWSSPCGLSDPDLYMTEGDGKSDPMSEYSVAITVFNREF